MSWCFAILNNRLAEIYFEEGKNNKLHIWGHCYVQEEEYITRKEQAWIKEDTESLR